VSSQAWRAHHLHIEFAPVEVLAIDVGNLQLAARRRLQRARNVDHPVVVEIQAGNGVARFRLGGLFLQLTACPAASNSTTP